MAPKQDPTITFFPVGNGDTSLIKLGDGLTILIDLNVTQDGLDEDEDAYDVRAHLRTDVRRDAERRPHLDVFILTRPDQDHVRGIEDVFFLGNPANYGKQHKDKDLIQIDELWFAPRIFQDESKLCDEAKAFKKEAQRRIDLYRKDQNAAAKPGNRMRVIGASDHDSCDDLEDITTIAGGVVNLFNGKLRDDLELFVHAPFKVDSDGDHDDRNKTSIIVQARFHLDDAPRALLVLFGGDATCPIWEKVYEQSDEEDLEWDVLLGPHHCSWTFFSEGDSDDGEPSETILALLGLHRDGAQVICSSKCIEDDDDNPPCHRAAELYREAVGENNVFCTMDTPDDPIKIRVTARGAQRMKVDKNSTARAAAARQTALGSPLTYG